MFFLKDLARKQIKTKQNTKLTSISYEQNGIVGQYWFHLIKTHFYFLCQFHNPANWDISPSLVCNSLE